MLEKCVENTEHIMNSFIVNNYIFISKNRNIILQMLLKTFYEGRKKKIIKPMISSINGIYNH